MFFYRSNIFSWFPVVVAVTATMLFLKVIKAAQIHSSRKWREMKAGKGRAAAVTSLYSI